MDLRAFRQAASMGVRSPGSTRPAALARAGTRGMGTAALALALGAWGCDEGGYATGDAADGFSETGDDLADAAAADEGGVEEAPGDGLGAEDAEVDAGEVSPPPPTEDWSRDILDIALEVDLGLLEATATIGLAPSASTGASFEAGGLDVLSVAGPEGPLEWRVVDGRLDVGVPSTGTASTVVVTYRFAVQPGFEGYMSRGSTLTWPWYCGNLFPCHPDPAEGQTFRLAVAGAPEGEIAVFPEELPADAPAYQIAWARGAYSYRGLGTTDAGTQVGMWTLPDGEAAGLAGTAHLVAVVDWYESTLGPYPFGDRLGPVQVRWPAGAYGGMEHHPYWHVSVPAMGDEAVHAHEAAHGWFGGGVRLATWEDLVLSEGTASYLQARVMGQAAGPEAEAEVWASYERELASIVASRDGIAWPAPFGDRDELLDWLFTRTCYMKGAYFYRAVADAVGAATLDAALGSFFREHVGRAAGMQALLDHLEAETGFDPAALAEGWLRSLGRPDE
jgi:hypothetical protein